MLCSCVINFVGLRITPFTFNLFFLLKQLGSVLDDYQTKNLKNPFYGGFVKGFGL